MPHQQVLITAIIYDIEIFDAYCIKCIGRNYFKRSHTKEIHMERAQNPLLKMAKFNFYPLI